jgi:hypothetical protein
MVTVKRTGIYEGPLQEGPARFATKGEMFRENLNEETIIREANGNE